MLTIFNRRELIVVLSQEQLFRVREALAAAGIASQVKMLGAARTVGGAGRGHRNFAMGLRQDAMYQYTIYVHKNDYERGFAAIQPALRSGR